MTYTTAKAAEKIRYFCPHFTLFTTKGLVPNVGRDEHGNRRFTDNDLQWLSLLQCLKNTGMSLKTSNASLNAPLLATIPLTNALHYLKGPNRKCEAPNCRIKTLSKLAGIQVGILSKAKALGSVEAVNLPQIPGNDLS